MSQSPHQAVIVTNKGPSWGKKVPDTPDLRRILSIPRRHWTDADAHDLAREMTSLLKVPGGTMDLRPFQAVALHDLCAYGGLVGMGRVGIGKSVAASHLVLTPSGYKKMGEISVGSFVVGSGGQPTQVEGVFPQGRLPIFRVHFSDGTYSDVSDDHLWKVEWRRRTKEKTHAVLTTRQLRERPIHEYEDTWGRRVKTDLKKKRIHIPTLSAPVDFLASEVDLAIDPYDLGVLIANGYLAGEGGAQVVIHKDDFLEVLEQMEWTPSSVAEKEGCCRAQFPKALMEPLTQMGLNVKSREKFIPEEYLQASRGDRIRLLQGLMDCDGSCSSARSKVTYHTASERLADDVQRLIELLGGQVRRHVYDREAAGHGLEFRLQLRLPKWVLPFTVARKASRYRPGMQSRPSRSIVSVEDLAREEECVCIKVSAEDHLFVLDHGVITHNTLISFLSPYVSESLRPVLIIPANLRKKTERDVMGYKEHWEISSMMDVQSYEMLARANHSYYLDLTKPDLIVCDEAHHLRNTKAAVTRRLKRYLETCAKDVSGLYPKKPKLVLLSGTFTNRSIKEYWHLLKWVLPREFVPLPLELSELDLWCMAIDEKVKPGQRVKPGALLHLCNEEEKRLIASGKGLAAVRRAYGRRLVETPGVVSTRETFEGSRLTVSDLKLKLPPNVTDAFSKLRKEWALPDGQPISDGTLAAKAAKELALGFFYRWNPWPPKEWADARKEWCQFVRRTLSRNKRELDTEEQVKIAVEAGHYPQGQQKLQAWLDVKDTFDINVEAVWLDDFAVDAAHEWSKKHKGIVWVYHAAFGKRLEAKSGLKYYGEGGYAGDGSFIEDHPTGTPLIASITANKEGKNLQGWHTNLVTHSPSSGGWWEQMMGRTHRDGQQADLVSFDMFASCIEHYQAFHRALGDAMFVQDSTPMVQKLLYADVSVPSLEDAEQMAGESWHVGELREED